MLFGVAVLLAGCRTSAPSAVQSIRRTSPGDSLIVERLPGYFDTLGLGSRWRPGYSVLLTRDGLVRLGVNAPGDTTRVAERRITSPMADELLKSAEDLGLGALPETLLGREPYCRSVLTDAPSIRILLFAGREVHQLLDYLGCVESNDRSETHVVRRLRKFERHLVDVIGVEAWVEGGGGP